VRVRSRLALLAAALLAAGAGRAEAAPVSVALLPVAIHSNDAGAAYLSAGLASMLSSRLDQFEEISVVRLEAAPGADQEAARAAARAAGADFVVFGSFTQFGEGASLDLNCARVEGGDAARRVFVQSGTLGEIIPKLDELAEKIRLYVSGGRAPADAAAAAPARPAELVELERRVEALERTVFRSGPEQGPAPPPAPKAADSGRPR
jgi:outer membrane protein insertion porin family